MPEGEVPCCTGLQVLMSRQAVHGGMVTLLQHLYQVFCHAVQDQIRERLAGKREPCQALGLQSVFPQILSVDPVPCSGWNAGAASPQAGASPVLRLQRSFKVNP